jgi:hypothetical protein
MSIDAIAPGAFALEHDVSLTILQDHRHDIGERALAPRVASARIAQC